MTTFKSMAPFGGVELGGAGITGNIVGSLLAAAVELAAISASTMLAVAMASDGPLPPRSVACCPGSSAAVTRRWLVGGRDMPRAEPGGGSGRASIALSTESVEDRSPSKSKSM